MQIIQKYAIIILLRSTAAQASANVSQENTNHLNGIYYLYRDSKTFLLQIADSAQFSLLHEMPIFGREDPKLKYGRFQRKT